MAILFTLAEVMVFTMLVGIGLRMDPDGMRRLLRDRRLLLRGLVSVVLVVPAIAFVLLWLFRLPAPMATGIAVLAAAPGAPLTTKRAVAGGGEALRSSTLQLSSAFLAILATPLWLAAFYASFDLLIGRIAPWIVLAQVGKVTLLPAGLGFALGRLAPKWASRVRPIVEKVANLLFLLMVVVLVAALVFEPRLRGKLDVGLLPTAAVAIWVVVSLAAGHVLGGPGLRSGAAVAIAGIARNLGLVLFILGLDQAGGDAVPMVFVYALVGFVLAVPYGLLVKRRLSELTTVDADRVSENPRAGLEERARR